MKVGSKAVMKFRDTKPLPSEITDERVNNATLPVKIETARRAIAACRDLPELLRYRDQAEGLAAAVRTMKQVGPEMIRAANCLMADAWRKGGELLNQYSSASPSRSGGRVSPRAKIAAELGLPPHERLAMSRLAAAKVSEVHALAQRTTSLIGASKRVATVGAGGQKGHSDGLRAILSNNNNRGLNQVAYCARSIDLANFKLLTVDERKVVKAKITEIVELLDEMDRLCR